MKRIVGLALGAALLACGTADPAAAPGGAGGAGGAGGEADVVLFVGDPTFALSPSGVLTASATTSEAANLTLTAAGQRISSRGPGTSFTLALALPPGEHRVGLTAGRAGAPSTDGKIDLSVARHVVVVPPLPPPAVVLFDAAHGQTSGNADWVVDDPAAREPHPADPASAEDWSGAWSSFGFGLHESGRFAVRTLPRGDAFDPGDLEGVAVVVLPEPNRPYGAAEKEALWDFVRGGGGLFLVANHAGADRDGDGWDAAEVARDLAASAGDLGIEVELAHFDREDPTRALTDHPVLTGPFGQVNALTFFDTTTLALSGSAAPVVRRSVAAPGSGILGAAARLGSGRVFVIGDSAGIDDGTGDPGDRLFDGWSDHDNAPFYLNVVSWLAGEIAG